MPFPLQVRLEALIACQRNCCLCHTRKHTRIQCHHIVPEADGGPDTFENCIPLCPDCHAEVMAFNPRHPFGATPYHASELKRRRDEWYAVIARRTSELSAKLHSSPAAYPQNSDLRGRASFDYSQFDGFYRLGAGNSEFLTRWSKGSDRSIHCYNDRTNVAVALAPVGSSLGDLVSVSALHFGSRVQSPQLEQIVILENHVGRYAALRISKIQDNTRRDLEDRLEFDFWILEDGSDDFSLIA